MNENILLVVLIVLILILAGLRFREPRHRVSGIRRNPIGSATTLGNREVQQDYQGSALGDEGTLMVLADGMGRGEGGKIAARVAVEVFRDLYDEYQAFDKPQYYFKRAFHLANHRILNVLDEKQGMASAAAAMVRDGCLYYALVGNVQVSVFRDGSLIPVTEGQTIDVLAHHRYEEGLLSKQTTIRLMEEQRLYNVLGTDEFRDIEFFSKPLKLYDGDVIVLMTDGVSHALKWVDIEQALDQDGTPEERARHVIEAVDKSTVDDKDNATVLLYVN